MLWTETGTTFETIPPTGVGKPAGDFSAKLASYENRIKDSPIEKCYALDKEGKKVLSKTGGKSSIELTAGELDLLTDTTFTHNHPNGRTFSLEDINLQVITGVKEMRAVTGEGTFSSMAVDSRHRGEKWAKKLRDSFDNEDRIVREIYIAEINAGKMTLSDANMKHHYEVWERVVKELPWLKYTKGEL